MQPTLFIIIGDGDRGGDGDATVGWGGDGGNGGNGNDGGRVSGFYFETSTEILSSLNNLSNFFVGFGGDAGIGGDGGWGYLGLFPSYDGSPGIEGLNGINSIAYGFILENSNIRCNGGDGDQSNISEFYLLRKKFGEWD